MLAILTPFALGAAAKERIAFNLATVNRNLEEGRCAVCKQKPGEEKAAIEVKMFGNVQRIPQYGSIRVTWQTMTIKIPRCQECKDKYGKSVFHSFSRLSFIGILGVILLRVTNQHFRYGSSDDFLVLAFGGLGVLLISAVLSEIFAEASPGKAKSNYPRVKELIAKGWQFGEKPQA